MNKFLGMNVFSGTQQKIRAFLAAKLASATNVLPPLEKNSLKHPGGNLDNRKPRLSHTNPASGRYQAYAKRKRRQKHARKSLARQQRLQGVLS